MFDRFGDFDLVLLAFGVLGDQDRAEHDRELSVEIAESNFIGAVSVTVPVVDAPPRRRATARSSCCRRSRASAPASRTSSTASKAGLDAFFQGLGDSLVGTGVSVMIVRPGFVHTKMTEGLEPAPLATTPEAVADAIVRGLGARLGDVWVPGALRYVMSVLRHVPRPVFRRLPI